MAIITTAKEVNQLIITMTVCIVLLIGGLTWVITLATRTIKDVNQKSTEQIIEDRYQSCIANTYLDKVNECKRAKQ